MKNNDFYDYWVLLIGVDGRINGMFEQGYNSIEEAEKRMNELNKHPKLMGCRWKVYTSTEIKNYYDSY